MGKGGGAVELAQLRRAVMAAYRLAKDTRMPGVLGKARAPKIRLSIFSIIVNIRLSSKEIAHLRI